jgi:HD superfamily phosphohydrolase YqeK
VELIPAVLHSYAAPVVIKRDFPEFATEKILSATYSHTLGRPKMTLFDKIIFIADYVEDGRVWHACRALSEKLFSGYDALDADGKIKRINEAILESIDNTIISLRERGARCSEQMLLTRASILTEI